MLGTRLNAKGMRRGLRLTPRTPESISLWMHEKAGMRNLRRNLLSISTPFCRPSDGFRRCKTVMFPPGWPESRTRCRRVGSATITKTMGVARRTASTAASAGVLL